MMKATVNENTCTGCGICADTCPDVFEIEDGLSRTLVTDVPVEFASACREAAESCPVEAITVVED